MLYKILRTSVEDPDPLETYLGLLDQRHGSEDPDPQQNATLPSTGSLVTQGHGSYGTVALIIIRGRIE
jgi:hypothetical protein